MIALTYRLTLLDPVLVKQVNNGDPNSGVGLDFIPGSSLRGALVGRYQGVKDAADADFCRLFLDGSVCYLNAYPTDSQSHRMLPTPLSWRSEKDSSNTIRDWAIEGVTDDEAKIQWEGVAKPFCTLWRGEEPPDVRAELWEREAQVNIHNARVDRQKATAAGATAVANRLSLRGAAGW
jgi:CRISPR-associated protein Csx10